MCLDLNATPQLPDGCKCKASDWQALGYETGVPEVCGRFVSIMVPLPFCANCGHPAWCHEQPKEAEQR